MSDLPTGVAYYTISELAAHLRVSEMTIQRAVRAGDLPALQLGLGTRPTVRIPVADAHEWIINNLNTTEETTKNG